MAFNLPCTHLPKLHSIKREQTDQNYTVNAVFSLTLESSFAFIHAGAL